MKKQELENIVKESLRDWFGKENWVRITTAGNIGGPCGTSKDTKNPDRCLPLAKARSLTKAQRAATAMKKKKATTTVVPNTKRAKVTRETANPQDGKAAPHGSGFKPITISRKKLKSIIKEVIKEQDDRCTRIAKRTYDTWPSAYASGAVVRCRRGEIWKDKK